MLTNNIKFNNFSVKSKNLQLNKILKNLKINYLKGQIKFLLSFTKNTCYELRDKILLRFQDLKLYLQNLIDSQDR